MKALALQTLVNEYIKSSHYQEPSYLAAKIESELSINDLLRLITSLDQDKELTAADFGPIVQLLENRWDRIKDTNLAYPSSPHSKISQLYLALAKEIYIVTGHQSPYQLLMPTLEVLEQDVSGLNIDDLQLHEFILSDDGKHFISVMNTLDFACEDGLLMKPYLINGKIVNLSSNESCQVINHSVTATKYYKTIMNQLHYQKYAGSFGGALRSFMQRLRNGGKSAIDQGHGSEYVAGENAIDGIGLFGEWLDTLNSDEKKYLFSLTAENLNSGYHFVNPQTGEDEDDDLANFGQVCDRLSDPQIVDDPKKQSAIYCVEILADKIERILKEHLELFDRRPVNASANNGEQHMLYLNYKKERTKARTALKTALTDKTYQVTSSLTNLVLTKTMLAKYRSTLTSHNDLIAILKSMNKVDQCDFIRQCTNLPNVIKDNKQLIEVIYGMDFIAARFELLRALDSDALRKMITRSYEVAHILGLMPNEFRLKVLDLFAPILASVLRDKQDIANIMLSLNNDLINRPINTRNKLKTAITTIEKKYKSALAPNTLKQLVIGVSQVYRDDLHKVGFFSRSKATKQEEANQLIQALSTEGAKMPTYKRNSTLSLLVRVATPSS